jgi:hypothetical protein
MLVHISRQKRMAALSQGIPDVINLAIFFSDQSPLILSWPRRDKTFFHEVHSTRYFDHLLMSTTTSRQD